LVGHALTVGDVGGSLLAFATAGLVIVLLLFGLALAVGTAQDALVEAIRARGPQAKHWGGAILVLVGVWFLILAIWADAFADVFEV